MTIQLSQQEKSELKTLRQSYRVWKNNFNRHRDASAVSHALQAAGRLEGALLMLLTRVGHHEITAALEEDSQLLMRELDEIYEKTRVRD